MTDTPFRKTLSLKLKKQTETKSNHESTTSNDITGRTNYQQHTHHSQKPKQNFQEQEVSFSTQRQHQNNTLDHVAELAKNDLLLQDLQKKRKSLSARIKVLEQRLVFISSEPLQAVCTELKKEDTSILCQINDYLIKGS